MRSGKVAPLLIALIVAQGSAVASAEAADVAHGKQIFAKCSPCHTTNQTSRVGPGLEGIVGRRAGSMRGFHYSRAMKNSKITWDSEALNEFLKAPQTKVPGTVMPFSGIADPEERADVIAYLETLR